MTNVLTSVASVAKELSLTVQSDNPMLNLDHFKLHFDCPGVTARAAIALCAFVTLVVPRPAMC
jgi:hypothetical protein